MNTDGPLRDKSELFVEIYFKIACSLFYIPGLLLIGQEFSFWTIPTFWCALAVGVGATMVVGAFCFMLWAANH